MPMPEPITIKVDAYAHVSPPKYTEVLKKDYPGFYNQILGGSAALYDMDTSSGLWTCIMLSRS